MSCLLIARFQARISHNFYQKVKELQHLQNLRYRRRDYRVAEDESAEEMEEWGCGARLMNFLPQICRGIPHVRLLTTEPTPDILVTSQSRRLRNTCLAKFINDPKVSIAIFETPQFPWSFCLWHSESRGMHGACKSSSLSLKRLLFFFVHVVQSITYPLMRACNPRRRGLVLKWWELE